jgi:hypothetical protein
MTIDMEVIVADALLKLLDCIHIYIYILLLLFVHIYIYIIYLYIYIYILIYPFLYIYIYVSLDRMADELHVEYMSRDPFRASQAFPLPLTMWDSRTQDLYPD